ncbi:MAG TPA: ammonium transporter [Polyangiaceae bacterium LLY-WYZ-14_1]|nr:ammonium transporter [Polyangiaceae bacterium LLY-WYZ-14_1]
MLDAVWVLVCAFLVFFMHAGFALVESGFCRRKNAVTVLLKNVGVVAIASVLFYLLGFGLMFGDGGPLVGLSGFAPTADASLDAAPGNLPLYVFLFFQLVFAATAVTIVSGAVAERARLGKFFTFAAIGGAVIYPVAGHWVWGGGFLAGLGFHDFAGSTVVHAVGGAMALAGVLVVGPRLGRFGPDGASHPMPAHNFPLAALGVLVLWLGWFGFNGGSTLAADPEAIAGIILVTNLAASAGFLGALLQARLRTGVHDLSMALNGALAGLVAITAGCDVIGPLPSLALGAVAGALVVEGVLLLDRLRLDDPVGAIPVHLGGGVLGTLAVGLLGEAEGSLGLLHGGGLSFLGVQALGVLSATTFAFMVAGAVWLALRAFPGGIRVDEEHERDGLDLAECGVHAYGEASPGELFEGLATR